MESDSLLLSNSGTLNFFASRRSIADVLPLIALAIFTLVWISIASYAFSTGDVSKIIPLYNLYETVEALTIRRILMTIGFSLLAGLLSLSVLGVVQWVPNFTHLTLVVLWLPFAVSLVLSIKPDAIRLPPPAKHIDIFYIFTAISTFCSGVITVVLIRGIWFHLPEAILKEASRAIASFPAVLLLSIVWHLLCVLILIFSIAVQLFLNGIPIAENPPIPQRAINGLMVVNAVGFNWLFMFTFYIGQMSLCKTFAIWFWTANKEEVPNYICLRCFKYTVRYHLGTIAYATSIFGLVRSLRTILNYVIYKIREGVDSNFWLFFAYNLLDGIVLRFVMYNAILQCAIYGKNYRQSVEDSMNSLSGQPKRCLLMSKMIEGVLLLAALYASTLVFLPALGYLAADLEPRGRLAILTATFLSYLIFVLPTIGLLVAAPSTILICALEDRNNGGPVDGPCSFPSSELSSALAESDGGSRRWLPCFRS